MGFCTPELEARGITLRPAREDERDKVQKFYNDVIDDMERDGKNIFWRKNEYPLKSWLEHGFARNEILLAVLTHSEGDQGGTADIVGAFILNEMCSEGYKNVPWTVLVPQLQQESSAGAQKAVEVPYFMHAFAISPHHKGKGYGRLVAHSAIPYCRYLNEIQQETKIIKCIRLDVLPHNAASMKVFSSSGYTQVGFNIKMCYEATGELCFNFFEVEI